MIWADNMLIPNLATHKDNAEKWINYYYEPEVAAKLAAYNSYICPVKGAQEAMEKVDPDHVDNELIFPTEKSLAADSRIHGARRGQDANLRKGFCRCHRCMRGRPRQRRARALSATCSSHGLTKEYATFTAVKALDLVVPQGTFFALLGPSGCGKTTTLRMVAGLETPTSGTIHLGDTEITYDEALQAAGQHGVPELRAVPAPQHLQERRLRARASRRSRTSGKQVADMLELVELTSQAHKKPAQMSGGQQQRVALARALINQPEVLLLDEPLGALDLKLRRGMQLELKRIQTEVGLTFVHVTHDQEEAMTMADTIAVMNQRRHRADGRARASSTRTRGRPSWPTSSASPTSSRPRSRAARATRSRSRAGRHGLDPGGSRALRVRQGLARHPAREGADRRGRASRSTPRVTSSPAGTSPTSASSA